MTERGLLIQTGDVVPAYPYLWVWQSRRGEEAGRKDRPVCVAIAIQSADGLTHLALLAITGTTPSADQRAVEIPPHRPPRVQTGLDHRLRIQLRHSGAVVLAGAAGFGPAEAFAEFFEGRAEGVWSDPCERANPRRSALIAA
ncbi:hypothetical protein M2322_004828 [Rhodoblastus acidophilus]|uniref:hypothetical protein n=1 Tax=Rhodoblastus acidophilus TaxID=1074 RepID=UPI00222553C3|nr:hypothetical protein [Rhodoblastus acidophilus]MCW2319259.1 hypothetical protein [Rhodoblastus acidophilus]